MGRYKDLTTDSTDGTDGDNALLRFELHRESLHRTKTSVDISTDKPISGYCGVTAGLSGRARRGAAAGGSGPPLNGSLVPPRVYWALEAH